LEHFLRGVEELAQSLDFHPTTLLNGPFDTAERREFSRRLGSGFTIQAEELRGSVLPAEGQIRNHNPHSGECRLDPIHGVVLVITDEQGCESCFGFFKYPEHIFDIYGAVISATQIAPRWTFRAFVNSPDPRYRQIVEAFSKAGFLKRATDEFNA
jgi:hypothetical protein